MASTMDLETLSKPTNKAPCNFETISHLINSVGFQEKKKMLNMVIKICKKIINHPNNKKYQSINSEKLNKKFTQITAYKLQYILIRSGFSVLKTNDNSISRWLFDDKQLNLLKVTYELLLSYKSNNNNLSYLCICGDHLVQIDDIRFDNLNFIICKLCQSDQMLKCNQYYHCNNITNNEIHLDGFNICNKCITKYDDISFINQNKNTFNNLRLQTHKNTIFEQYKLDMLCYGYVNINNINMQQWPKEINDLCLKYIGNIFIGIDVEDINSFGLNKLMDDLKPIVDPYKYFIGMDVADPYKDALASGCGHGSLIWGPSDKYRELLLKGLATLYKLDYLRVSGTKIMEMYQKYNDERYFEKIWQNAEITAKSKNKRCILFFDELEAIYFDSKDNQLKFNLLHFFLNNLYNNFRRDKRYVSVIASINNIEMFDMWLALNKMNTFYMDLPDLHQRISLFSFLCDVFSLQRNNLNMEFIGEQICFYTRSDIERLVNTLKIRSFDGYISNMDVKKVLNSFDKTVSKKQYQKFLKDWNEIQKLYSL